MSNDLKEFCLDEFDVYIKFYKNEAGEDKRKIEITANKAYHDGLIDQLLSRGANTHDVRDRE